MAYEKLNLADGDVLKAEHLAHMENELGREKSWNELADRPFGETEIVIFEEQTIIFDGGFGGATAQGCPSIGSAVTVTWNGTAYNCITQDFMGFPAVGNIDSFNGTGDTGEPFVVMFDASSNSMSIIETSGYEASVLLKIEGVVTNKLPSKYYSITTMMYSDGIYLYTDMTFSTKYTATQFMEMLQSAHIFCNFGGVYSALISGGLSENIHDNTFYGYGYFMVDDKIYKLYTAEYTE